MAPIITATARMLPTTMITIALPPTRPPNPLELLVDDESPLAALLPFTDRASAELPESLIGANDEKSVICELSVGIVVEAAAALAEVDALISPTDKEESVEDDELFTTGTTPERELLPSKLPLGRMKSPADPLEDTEEKEPEELPVLPASPLDDEDDGVLALLDDPAEADEEPDDEAGRGDGVDVDGLAVVGVGDGDSVAVG